MKHGLSVQFVLSLILLSIFPVTLGASDKEPSGSEPQKRVNLDVSCLAAQTAIEDMSKAKEELENRKKELTAKEAELRTRENMIQEQLKSLENMRDLISKTQVKIKIEDEEKINRLVETMLTMSPKAASKMLSSLDDRLAVSAISKMETQRLGKILNVTDPVKFSKLSELMAGVIRTSGSSSGVTEGVSVSQGSNSQRSDQRSDRMVSFSTKGGGKSAEQSRPSSDKGIQ